MKQIDYEFETKDIGDDGFISGIAAGYGNIDHGGDLIMPGALTKSIAGRSAIPMLLFHDMKRPVGVWNKFTETSDGLLVDGKISVATQSGKEAHTLTKDGALRGLSIGFRPLRHQMGRKARELHEIALHEISLVSVPMNDRTQITSVKDILEGGNLPTLPDFEDFLRDAGGFSRTQAKAIASHGLKHLTTQREAGRDGDDLTAFLAALLPKGD